MKIDLSKLSVVLKRFMPQISIAVLLLIALITSDDNWPFPSDYFPGGLITDVMFTAVWYLLLITLPGILHPLLERNQRSWFFTGLNIGFFLGGLVGIAVSVSAGPLVGAILHGSITISAASMFGSIGAMLLVRSFLVKCCTRSKGGVA